MLLMVGSILCELAKFFGEHSQGSFSWLTLVFELSILVEDSCSAVQRANHDHVVEVLVSVVGNLVKSFNIGSGVVRALLNIKV